ncbi:hypothetical protein A4S05_21370 [Nostoc sp. KVJ20]|uniref:hypothetical protein n=1 Tax=Nostoc sp. KVJ20 TaxID=457944 RepID=UPI00083CB139|nr:hypothetical protein [Nostoc sp. KVJ20]ODH03033.1 hypothetical protein A4S05_21370 [Nostoc sp. KVJ20]
MEQNQQVIISIKRTLGTIDGQIINYLHSRPFGLGNLPEIVMLTLLEYWSPFAISANGVDGEELRQRAIWSIKKLEAQAALIREVFLSSQVQTAVTVDNSSVNNSASHERLMSTIDDDDDQTLDEDIDELTELKLPEEIKQINNLFNIE